jgi:hypothetical protein
MSSIPFLALNNIGEYPPRLLSFMLAPCANNQRVIGILPFPAATNKAVNPYLFDSVMQVLFSPTSSYNHD